MESLSVLIIEDIVMTATSIRQTMEKAGHTVLACARSFDDAITAAREHTPDIVILDIKLEGSRDGIDVAQEILAHRKTPIVVLTGSTENETFIRAKEKFIPAAYLTKPFRPADLIRTVELAWQNFNLLKEVDGRFKEAEGTPQTHVFLPVEKNHVKIVKSEVLYIETQKSKHAVHIFEVYKKDPRLVQRSMAEIESHFTAPDFFRLSRSVIINLAFVERISGTNLYLERLTTPFSIPEKTRVELMRQLGFR